MPHKGYKQSLQHRKKLSLLKIGFKNSFYGKHHSKASKLKMSLSTFHFGKDNPNWKGGRIVRVDGYSFIKTHSHPFRNKQNYILEHRVIVEKYLKRYLKKNEQVHHIDNNPRNNKALNLMCFRSNSAHKRYHKNIYNVKKFEIVFNGRDI